eukprot:11020750-Karenia_brevis.AAC.1
MAKYYGDDKWYVIEDRIPLWEWGRVEGCEKLLTFLQEPKFDRNGRAFFCSSPSFNLDEDDDVQFVHLPRDHFQCQSCSKYPKRHRSSLMTEFIMKYAASSPDTKATDKSEEFESESEDETDDGEEVGIGELKTGEMLTAWSSEEEAEAKIEALQKRTDVNKKKI